VRSQGNTSVNPDTYLFWDSLHPTTYGHSVLASTALTLIGTPVTTTTAVVSSNADANLNSSVTLTASVTGASGTPMGTVTFLDGTTTLGTGLLSGSSTVATAAISTSSLTAGTHSITASYAGVNGYVSSTSPTLSEIVVAPAYSASVSPSSLTISRGATTGAVLTLTPVGGYIGNFTLACGTLPAHFSCMLGSTTGGTRLRSRSAKRCCALEEERRDDW